jgi:TRAP-type C4-dicarboxylate transport system substrate-binding protein
MKHNASLLFLAAALATAAAQAQAVKWDLPSGYGPNTFQVQNLQQFAADVDKATGGKLKIAVHPNASLGPGACGRVHSFRRLQRGTRVRCGLHSVPGH